MLAIRLQRTGRKGHAQFRVIVQDAHRSPSSGKVVKFLGSYDPHTKVVILDKEKAAHFLEHGAQPSPRVAYLLNKEGVKLPTWVKLETGKTKAIKSTDKLRRNRPADAEPAKAEEPEAEAPPAEETSAETVEAEEATTPAPEPAEEVEAVAETTEPEVPTEDTKA
jgi:small subunit ribosomal protein S16